MENKQIMLDFVELFSKERASLLTTETELDLDLTEAPKTAEINDYSKVFNEIKQTSNLILCAIESKSVGDRFSLNNNNRIIIYLRKIKEIYALMRRDVRHIIRTGCIRGSVLEQLIHNKVCVAGAAFLSASVLGAGLFYGVAWLVEYFEFCAVATAWAPPVAAAVVGVGLFAIIIYTLWPSNNNKEIIKIQNAIKRITGEKIDKILDKINAIVLIQ